MRFVAALLVMLSMSSACGQEWKLMANGRYSWVMADNTGKEWESNNRDWVTQQVAKINAGVYRVDTMTGPPVSASISPEDNQGVVFEKMPHAPKLGRVWGSNSESPDDGDLAVKPEVYLTVVGPTAGDVIGGWKRDPEFADVVKSMGGRLAIKAYPKGYATNEGLKIEDGGSPDILIQTGNGREVKWGRFRSDPGASAIVGGIRRADPTYRPVGIDPLSGDISDKMPAILLFAAIVFAGLAWGRKG